MLFWVPKRLREAVKVGLVSRKDIFSSASLLPWAIFIYLYISFNFLCVSPNLLSKSNLSSFSFLKFYDIKVASFWIASNLDFSFLWLASIYSYLLSNASWLSTLVKSYWRISLRYSKMPLIYFIKVLVSCYGFDIHFDTSVEMNAEIEARMLYILASPYFSDKNSLKLKMVD